MKLTQIAKNRMYKNVLGFFIANAEALSAFERLETEIELFTTQNTALNNFINQQVQTSKGFTGDKNRILARLIANTVNAARKALVYAVDEGDTVLLELFTVQVSDLHHLAQDVAIAKMQNIYDGLKPLAVALLPYNVSEDDIAAVNAGIIAFKAAQPGTGNARAARKAATKGIKTTIALIDASLAVLDNLIFYGIKNADLVSEYRSNRKINAAGIRHTGIVAIIDNAAKGNPVAGATMEIAALHKSALSNLMGVAEISIMKPGLYDVMFSAPGYVPQTFTLKISRGIKLEMNINLLQSVQEMEIVKAA